MAACTAQHHRFRQILGAAQLGLYVFVALVKNRHVGIHRLGLVELALALEVERQGFSIGALTARFDAEHKRLFTFNLGVPQELVNIRVVALGKAANVGAEEIARGDGNPAAAKMRDHEMWMDGKAHSGAIYDRAKLRSGDTIKGPAIVIEMDSTTLIHAGHVATVDTYGNILIRPEA